MHTQWHFCWTCVSFPESYQNGRGTELCTSSLSLGWVLTYQISLCLHFAYFWCLLQKRAGIWKYISKNFFKKKAFYRNHFLPLWEYYVLILGKFEFKQKRVERRKGKMEKGREREDRQTEAERKIETEIPVYILTTQRWPSVGFWSTLYKTQYSVLQLLLVRSMNKEEGQPAFIFVLFLFLAEPSTK